MSVEFLSLAEGALAYQRQVGDNRLPGIVFLGGYASTMQGAKAVFLANFCQVNNISFIRFDYRGCGRSPGDFRQGTIGGWLSDAESVLQRLTGGPQILVGSSMGGWLALWLARRYPQRVSALIGVAAAPDFTEELVWKFLTAAQKEELERVGEIYNRNASADRQVPMTRLLIEEARQHLVFSQPFSVDCPVRLLHGMQDDEVPWTHATRLITHIDQADTHMTLLKNGDHHLSGPLELGALGATIAAFLKI